MNLEFSLACPLKPYYIRPKHVIHGPHDKIFKRVMVDRENAISLLENILPEPVRKMLVLEDMLQKTV